MKELNEEDDEKLPVRKNFSGNNRKHFYSRQNHSFFFRFLNIKYREKRERMKKKKKKKKKRPKWNTEGHLHSVAS